MITKQELLSGNLESDLTPEQLANLEILLERINKLRNAYGKPLKVTSGVRTMNHHLQIYADKGITDKSKIPMKSKHLSCEACDIVPIGKPVKDLHDWIKANVKLMEEIGLWFEDFSATETWTHCQIVAPKSGKRFFLP